MFVSKGLEYSSLLVRNTDGRPQVLSRSKLRSGLGVQRLQSICYEF